ncbi:MAG TPA: 3-deoxy-D-manno-octulosonic acid transferase [bacterium]|nr:3-deoxy-D-manno-octulosonic acid transferase [bacterium]
MYFLYSILLFLFLLFSGPYFLFRMITKGKYKKGLKQRLGLTPPRYTGAGLISKVKSKDIIWIHAVSVGEVIAASPIVDAIRKRFPKYSFLISTVTDTGQDMARKTVSDPKEIIYFPLDFRWIVNKALKSIKPKLFIMVETELWPNFIREAKRRKIPLAIVNGRISPGSYKGYRTIKPFLKRVLFNIDLFCMQSELDEKRIISLGAPKERVHVTGNVKFDGLQTEVSDKERLAEELRISSQDLVLVAGSTHSGEEEIILDIYQKAREEYPNLRLILAPRHPERIPEVESLCKNRNLSYIRRSQLSNIQPPKASRAKGGDQGSRIKIILLDTIGELAKVYSLATIVFVGGSLVPVGGHNILEPATLGKVPLFGPYMHNFVESARLLIEGKGGIQARDREELLENILDLLKNPEKKEKTGKSAQEIVKKHQGAAERTVELIGKLWE